MATPPQSQSIQQQAAGYAGAAVPTVGSINQQYGQSIGDAQQFATALIHLLQQGGVDPYGSAVASQTGANNEAVARLQALGSPYAAASAAAVGGMGDSALAALNARRGAAQTYLKALPGIAAAKGQQSALALRNAEGQAITARNQQYSQAYQQSLQQLRAQQIQQQQFATTTGLQRAQMAQQASQFAQDMAFRQQQLAVSHAQFEQQYGAQSQTAQSQLSGLTPTEVSSMTARAGVAAQKLETAGLPIQKAINQLVHQNGIAPVIATRAIYQMYSQMTPPQFRQFIIASPPSTYSGPTFSYNGQKTAYDRSAWSSAMQKWRTAQLSLMKFIQAINGNPSSPVGPRGGAPYSGGR